MVSKVASVVKLTVRNNYHQMRQGPIESIISYKEHFNHALQAYKDNNNPVMDDADNVMDFFRGLDNTQSAEFKTVILNGLTSKLLTAPKNWNEMFQLANQWVKPVTRSNEAGHASTFIANLDRQPPGNEQGYRGRSGRGG
jgi:hypothetical protein